VFCPDLGFYNRTLIGPPPPSISDFNSFWTFFCPPKNWEFLFPGVKSLKFATFLVWKNSTNFLYHKIKEKETLNFEQNLEESCDIKIDFCDIENLENISLNLANVVKFKIEKKFFSLLFCPPPPPPPKKKKKKAKFAPPK
jgi:hypothetical protein